MVLVVNNDDPVFIRSVPLPGGEAVFWSTGKITFKPHYEGPVSYEDSMISEDQRKCLCRWSENGMKGQPSYEHV